MKKKRSVSLLTYVLSLVAVLIVGIIGTYFVLGGINRPVLITPDDFTKSIINQEQTEDSDQADLGTVAELFTVLSQEYYGDVESEALIQGALEGMTDAVEDPHTTYLDSIESSDLSDEISGSFEGIGAEVMKEEDKVRVVSPIPGAPADEAGILPNDYILEVDGESVADLNVQEAVQLIRGPEGTEVELLIERAGSEFKLTVQRDSIPIESVVYEQLESDPSIGHIHITRFNQPTYDELVNAIKDLEDKGVSQFIFDVRGNPGGLLDIALQMANIFVPEGEPLMQMKDNEDEEPAVFVSDNDKYGDFKFDENHEAVILINEGSASASEILAGAMQEAGYTVIGTPSYGKGTVQSLYPLSGGGEVKITNKIWLTAGGDWINEEGIQPDITVEQLGQGSLLLIDPEQDYQLGDTSEEVANINTLLDLLGYDVPMTDEFTVATQQAVVSLQAKHGLDQDGVVSDATATRLMQDVRDYISENDKQIQAAVDYFNE